MTKYSAEDLKVIYAQMDREEAEEKAKQKAARSTLKVGDCISFKCDIEQSAEIVKINRSRHSWNGTTVTSYTVKAPPDGFSGHYIGRDDFYEVDEDDVWVD